jgi:DNA-binding transcriptional MerR regulator
MGSRVSIGDFSVMTRLSKKALRHYHDVGLLEPAHVDRFTGYRFYDTGQVDHAHLVRRFRSLGMSIPDLKALLSADDPGERNDIVAAHLQRMEEQLEQTREVVRQLGEILAPATRDAAVELREDPQMAVWAITSTIDIDDIGPWFADASAGLSDAVRRSGCQSTGPAGGVYHRDLFAESRGEATVYLPIAESEPLSPARRLVLPAGQYAVLTHQGTTHCDIDRSYGRLGSYVGEHLISAEGPIRERYLGAETGRFTPFDRTEICWPIFGIDRSAGDESS